MAKFELVQGEELGTQALHVVEANHCWSIPQSGAFCCFGSRQLDRFAAVDLVDSDAVAKFVFLIGKISPILQPFRLGLN